MKVMGVWVEARSGSAAGYLPREIFEEPLPPLTDQQKAQAVAYIAKHEDDGWESIAAVLSAQLNRPVTGSECFSLYVDRLCG
jgi:hypothetical protein